MPLSAGDPTSTLPTWAPTLQEVAAYTTARTLVPNTTGGNTELAGFSSLTHPTDTMVNRFIVDAVGAVLIRTGALDTTLFGQANTVSTIMAAGYVEMRTPERQSANRDDAYKTGEFLLKRADALLEQLALRNEALTGDDPTDQAGVGGVLPVWSFPPAPADTTW